MRLIKTGVVAMLALGMLAGCGGDGDEGYNTKTVDNFTVMWKTNDAADSLLVKVSATTVGLVMIGFDLNPLNGLQGANIITGYVASDTAYIRDNFGTGLQAYAADVVLGGTDDATDKAGTEIDGVTEISFTIPLDSGDSRDCVLEVGQAYIIFLAWGTADNHDAPYTVYVSTEIDI